MLELVLTVMFTDQFSNLLSKFQKNGFVFIYCFLVSAYHFLNSINSIFLISRIFYWIFIEFIFLMFIFFIFFFILLRMSWVKRYFSLLYFFLFDSYCSLWVIYWWLYCICLFFFGILFGLVFDINLSESCIIFN